MKDVKESMLQVVQAFSNGNLTDKALDMFKCLSYNIDRQAPLSIPTFQAFSDLYVDGNPNFKEEKALVTEWKYVDLLFQLSDTEITKQTSLFDSRKVITSGNSAIAMHSYLFFVIELTGAQYTRTALSNITREINKLFPMPVMVLFMHGEALTLAVLNRRLHKRDEGKDVLLKVTLIKDINIASPHRAHIEILFDISFDELLRKHKFTNFVELHKAWEMTLDTKELNKRFYKELADWYFWAMKEVYFPGAPFQAGFGADALKDPEVREHNAKNLIRLLTRILFVWFIKEKSLIPEELFDERFLKESLLKDFEAHKRKGLDYKTQGSKYYRAVLQNLFFATLNQTMGKREFRKNSQHMNITNLVRYEGYFKNPALFIDLVEKVVPFMNGGLFECLDRPHPDKKGKQGGDVIIYIDGFSDRPDNQLMVPDYIFFDPEEHVDLSEDYGDKTRGSKDIKVRGLINLLRSYKFTITENTPIEEEIALDPELLGRVFENLLASYNPETKTTARKQTGSFYTPREIVNYMVDESLKAYLKQRLADGGMKEDDTAIGLDYLFEYNEYNEKEHLFNDDQTEILINAIDSCTILDPACGSGAFPMGVLHKMVHILHKLDPDNRQWKERQIEKARQIDDPDIRDRLISDIEDAFTGNELDYGRKLYLIENCIYGVDIQPIAAQISKLRFFISLIVDQKTNKEKDNFGIRPLPNLETKFVAANTLIDIEKPQAQGSIFENHEITKLEDRLKDVRHRLFSAKTPSTKRKLRDEDKSLREKMGELLVANGWGNETARQLAGWDPYDQNASSPFFDPEWMFGTEDGFDMVIGNPPYLKIQTIKQNNPSLADYYKKHYEAAKKGNYDIYVVFVERGFEILNDFGFLSFILPHKFFNAEYGEPLRILLAKGKHLSHVVHFGDQQVFPGATNYVCLLFLSKTSIDELRYVKAESLDEWFKTNQGLEERISAYKVTGSQWNFEIGPHAEFFERLNSMPVKLGDVADIFVGLQTSADDVFILDLIEEAKDTLRLRSKASKGEVVLEKSLLRSLISGVDVKKHQPLPYRQFILFPYIVKDERVYLIPFEHIRELYPKTAAYLTTHRARLENREDGRMRGKNWYGYIYLKNMARQSLPKICVPRLVDELHAAIDLDGTHYLDNVDVGGVTWKGDCADNSLHYLLALLNSRIFQWFFPKVSAPFRGGFRSANRQFLSLLPMPNVTPAQQAPIIALVNQILADPHSPDVPRLEAEINCLVYGLYNLTDKEIGIVDKKV